MCGITGFWALEEKENNLKNLREMAMALNHRGPDNTGYWHDSNNSIYLAHNRLSIIDLTIAGNQPMVSHSGRYIISYNGEIYNHYQLKKELEKNCVFTRWRGHSDTEVLLTLIDKYGLENALNKCVGMFALAIWDKQEQCLSLARDRMGEKPLYYGFSGNNKNEVFLFGSELSALKKWDNFSNPINNIALNELLNFQAISAPNSIYKDIYQLKPGHIITIKYPKKEILSESRSWWDLNSTIKNCLQNKIDNFEQAKASVEKSLSESVKLQSIADVSLGTFLSGGIDSSLITALLQNQSSKKVKTYTIGFEEDNYNEAHFSKEIANYLDTDHTEFFLTSKDALKIIPELSKIFSEPFADSSQLPTYLVCNEVRKSGLNVALSGDGGDELFGGYNRYFLGENIWKNLKNIPWFLRSITGRIGVKLPHRLIDQFSAVAGINNFGSKILKLSERLKYIKNEDEFYYSLISQWENPNEIINPEFNYLIKKNFLTSLRNNLPNEFDDDLTARMMIFDSLHYLPNDILAKVDRSAMATSLETRSPFLDHRVIETAWKLDMNLKVKKNKFSTTGKWILREILSNYIPRNLFERPKAGFGIPLAEWLREPLKDWAGDLLNKQNIKKYGYLNEEKVNSLWLDHINYRTDNSSKLWPIIMWQAWLENNAI